MPQLVDARGNEFLGSVDQVGGGVVSDLRVSSGLLAALNSELMMDLNGQAVAVFDIRTAAANLTVLFEATVDNTNYFVVAGFNPLLETMLAAVDITTTHAATYIIGCSGFRRIRARISIFTSGNVTVFGRASTGDYAIYARPIPARLHVTATAAVNTGATATLPAAGFGLFHYITKVELVKLYNVVGVAAGAGVIVTTTNLPGTPAFTTEQLALAAGSVIKVIDWNPYAPLKSSVSNIATTFVAPAQLQTIWRWNISYYVGA